MKKKYLLLSGLILGSSMLFAQKYDFDAIQHKGEISTGIESPRKSNSHSFDSKAYGDTLYHETFDSNLNGWTVANNTGNSNNWEWHNAAPGGMHTTEPMIASTSGPGFLSLRMDFLNTPVPPSGAAAMDAWVTSPEITIPSKPSVFLQFEHAQRYCCNASTDSLLVEVSTDGISFATYDATKGRGANSPSPNGELIKIDVTEQLANQTKVYIRFRVVGAVAYYWMVDDVALTEGPKNAMEVQDFFIQYHSGKKLFAPNYRAYPLDQANDVTYSVYTKNAGSNLQTNVEVTAEVYHDSTLSGVVVNNQVYSEDSLVGGLILPLQKDTTAIGAIPFVVTDTGYYSHRISVSSDSANQFPLEDQTARFKFRVTDSVYALDGGNFSGTGGPGGYVVGGADGDKIAQLFIVENKTYATSISVAIPPVEGMHDIKISPIIYGFNEDTIISADVLNLTTYRAAFSSQPIYSTPFFTEVDTTTMGRRWNTIKLEPAVELQPGAYYVGFEQYEGANIGNGKKMFFYRDRETEPYATGLSTAMYLANSTNPGWGTAPLVLSIRLNTGNTIIGIDENVQESNTKFAVAPNPNNGEFKLFLNSEVAANYTLNVHNMLGQVVHTESVSVNGFLSKDMNLSGYDKGVYFVSLVNDNERLVKKIVLK